MATDIILDWMRKMWCILSKQYILGDFIITKGIQVAKQSRVFPYGYFSKVNKNKYVSF